MNAQQNRAREQAVCNTVRHSYKPLTYVRGSV